MRMSRNAVLVSLAVATAGVAGGTYAAAGGAGQRVVPSVLPQMAVFQDVKRAGAPEPELASTFSSATDAADMAKTRVLARGLGRHDSRLVAFPSKSGSSVCYALLGRTPHDPAMSYCYQPLAPDAPGPLAGQHFHAVALYSNIDGKPGVQLFGIAFNDVESIRVQVSGAWRPVPVRSNGFYLDLPNVAQEDIGIVEATLADGGVQQHDIQSGG
jgi:hypothetical protein